jgi:hypothetical protein
VNPGKHILPTLMIATLAAAVPARAEVTSAGANGFVAVTSIETSATPAEVYAAMLQPGHWWNKAHTYSGDSTNLKIDAHPGGCFCETIPASHGSIEHARIVLLMPGAVLRMRGAFGPLQEMGVEGSLTWQIKTADGHTRVTQSYAVGGFFPKGAEPLAPIVDGVMADQAGRLKAYLDEIGRAHV